MSRSDDVRAKKEWEEEQALRVKSNTIVLDAKTW